MRTTAGTSLMRLAVTACALAALVGTSATARATPSTPQIEEKSREAAAAQERLDDLAAQLELRGEEYQQITEDLAKTRIRVADTQADLEAARGQLNQAQTALSDRAAKIYRAGNVGIVEVFFGVRDFGDLLSLLDFMRHVARSDAQAVSSVKTAVKRVESAERMLETREAEQTALRERARLKHAEVQIAVKRQDDYLRGLNAEVAQLIREERARQARIAAERARRAAIAAAAAARAAASRKAVNAANERHFDAGTLGTGHPEVVEIGLKYLGVPYVWGGSSPVGFDCSGLTQYVYAQAGIDIPRTSRSQFTAGAYIPPDRLDLLSAGDLVFFGYGGDSNQVHHVGIYIGDGSFLHAPQTGENVQVASLNGRIASRGDYVGGRRF